MGNSLEGWTTLILDTVRFGQCFLVLYSNITTIPPRLIMSSGHFTFRINARTVITIEWYRCGQAVMHGAGRTEEFTEAIDSCAWRWISAVSSVIFLCNVVEVWKNTLLFVRRLKGWLMLHPLRVSVVKKIF
jgi:hypothetical protein